MNDKPLDLRQLEAFAAVMSTGSITGAARLIGKSQSAVTRLIQDLESDLGFALFERHGRRITPTQNGALFFKDADQLLAGASRIRQRAAELAHRQVLSLDIVATASLAASVVPAALARLQAGQALPPTIALRSLLPEDVIQAVARREADIGIASMPLDDPAVEVHWIGEASCVCVLRADDPLARNAVVTLKDLSHRSLITMSNPYRVLGRISAALERVNVTAKTTIKTNASVTAIRLVQAGLGVALLEPLTPGTLQLPGIAVRPLDVSIPYLWGIISPLGLPASPIIQPFAAALIEAARMELTGFKERDVRDMESILKDMYAFASGDLPDR